MSSLVPNKRTKLSTWSDLGVRETENVGYERFPNRLSLGYTPVFWWKNKTSTHSYSWNQYFFPVKPLEGWDRLLLDMIDPWLYFSMKHPGLMVVPHSNLRYSTDDEVQLWLAVNGHITFVDHQKLKAIIVNWLVSGVETTLIQT